MLNALPVQKSSLETKQPITTEELVVISLTKRGFFTVFSWKNEYLWVIYDTDSI